MIFRYYWDKIISKIDRMTSYKIYCHDNEYIGCSIAERMEKLSEKIDNLETRIMNLEVENVGSTNELYRLENSLDARIDILAEHLGVVDDV